MAISKDELSKMIQQLPEQDLDLVHNLVKRLINSTDSHIPYDDEPLTEDDKRAIKEAKIEYQQGKTLNLKDIENELRS
ncbi:hypothetical protein [Caldalkalibacillus salinus]|uniref:hypothetical protein n=1 Tax=Caldalkalibacillus salinus TaxID=2803787 RepID=UPI0019239C82|nr:hypothetical protein [Caldalkalibacillus salinus]